MWSNTRPHLDRNSAIRDALDLQREQKTRTTIAAAQSIEMRPRDVEALGGFVARHARRVDPARERRFLLSRPSAAAALTDAFRSAHRDYWYPVASASSTDVQATHPEPGAPAGGIRPPIARANACWRADRRAGERAEPPGATRRRARSARRAWRGRRARDLARSEPEGTLISAIGLLMTGFAPAPSSEPCLRQLARRTLK
jgi:hypothetical protein